MQFKNYSLRKSQEFLKNYLLKKLSFNRLKQIKKAIFKILLVALFKIAIVYISIVKLLSKQIILIAKIKNARLLNKTFRSLLTIVTIVSKVSFYILRVIYRIY